MRIGIYGWPGTGKTTLAAELGARYSVPTVHVDAFKNWDKLPDEVAAELSYYPAFIIEGLFLPRGLRRYFELHPGEKCPLDRLIICRTPYRKLSMEAIRAARGQDTILTGLLAWLPDIETGLRFPLAVSSTTARLRLRFY